MPYSMDPEANKQNPVTPSPMMDLHQQLIYKLAALDASVQSGFRRLDERMDRFQQDINDNKLQINEAIVRLSADLDKQETKWEAELNERFNQKKHLVEGVRRDLCADLEKHRFRLDGIERWRDVLVARMTLAGGIFIFIWALISDPVTSFINRLFGGH